eukprot:5105754-Prymnesium_polylepis.1
MMYCPGNEFGGTGSCCTLPSGSVICSMPPGRASGGSCTVTPCICMGCGRGKKNGAAAPYTGGRAGGAPSAGSHGAARFGADGGRCGGAPSTDDVPGG